MRRLIVVLSALLISAVSAEAQIAWDAPPLVSPAAPAGVSLFLFSPAGGDLGGLVTFRHSAGPVGVGYRFAVTDDGPGDGVAFGAGIDISGFLARGLEESELDVMWFSGAGLGLGDETVVSFPLGALIGWTGGDGGTTLSPYAGGHIALDISSLEQDNVNLGAAADLGLDIGLSSGLLLRFGASVGDRDALAVGVRLKT